MLLTPGTIRPYKNDLVVYKHTCICYFKSSILLWAIAIRICANSGSQNSGTLILLTSFRIIVLSAGLPYLSDFLLSLSLKQNLANTTASNNAL